MTQRSNPYARWLTLALLADMGWLVLALTAEELDGRGNLVIIVTSALVAGTLSVAGLVLAERARVGREALALSIEQNNAAIAEAASAAAVAQAANERWQRQTAACVVAMQRELDAARDRSVMHSAHLDGRLDELATAEQLENTQGQTIQALVEWAADREAYYQNGKNGRPALVQVNGSRGARHN